MAKPKRQADCHPDRPNAAFGLCHMCYRRNRSQTDPEYREREYARARKWEEANPSKRLRINLWTKFKITLEDYEQMVKAQDNKCAICHQPERIFQNGKRMRLSVDHDHETNQIRALLCRGCNRGLGHFNEDPKALKEAARYLSKYKLN